MVDPYSKRKGFIFKVVGKTACSFYFVGLLIETLLYKWYFDFTIDEAISEVKEDLTKYLKEMK